MDGAEKLLARDPAILDENTVKKGKGFMTIFARHLSQVKMNYIKDSATRQNSGPVHE
jgi:hypothetical protein